MFKPVAAVIAGVACIALLSPTLHAESIDAEFRLPNRDVRANIFGAPDIERSGGGLTHTGWLSGAKKGSSWPYRGFEISSHSSLYPVFLAVGQSVDFAIPVLPWLAPMVRVEGYAGLIFTGVIFDLGTRARIDISDTLGVFFEGTGRFGLGELTIAELFESFYEEYVDAHIDQVSGFGFSTAVGVELGGPNVRFTIGLHLSYLFLDAALRLGKDLNIDLPTISVATFGFTFGMRFFVG
jgi:hypothetical protein